MIKSKLPVFDTDFTISLSFPSDLFIIYFNIYIVYIIFQDNHTYTMLL